jgi:predicted ATPase
VGEGDDMRIVRRIDPSRRPPNGVDGRAWPFTLPPVAQLLRDGLEVPPGVTFLVGENGTGKSTVTEGVAMAYGLDPEGGKRPNKRGTQPSGSALDGCLDLVRSPHDPKQGFFLTAATMRGWYTLESKPGASGQRVEWHEMSHGESFTEVLRQRFDGVGFYVLDEPEAALSFSACLGLVGLLKQVADEGSQVLCATHSPVLTALPGATILQLDDSGFHLAEWDDLELVRQWRGYLDDPQCYLRHLLAD